jgi:hypothetical protein
MGRRARRVLLLADRRDAQQNRDQPRGWPLGMSGSGQT